MVIKRSLRRLNAILRLGEIENFLLMANLRVSLRLLVVFRKGLNFAIECPP
jgi:hypothetical protein